MLTGVSIRLSPSDRARLIEVAVDRNRPQKCVWRAQIMLLSADGVGTSVSFAPIGWFCPESFYLGPYQIKTSCPT